MLGSTDLLLNMQTSQNEILIRERLESVKLEMITQNKKKINLIKREKNMGDSELARHQKYVRINSKAAILCWYWCLWGCSNSRETTKEISANPLHARKACRCPTVPAGLQCYIRWEHFLRLMISVCPKASGLPSVHYFYSNSVAVTASLIHMNA